MAITDKLTDIADAIRDKTGTTDKYNLVGMAETIETIQGGAGTGEDGGYYTPVISQTSSNAMTIAFTASKSGMPEVSPTTITLPTGENTAVIESIEISEV